MPLTPLILKRLFLIAPGLEVLRHYSLSHFSSDLRAGASVAAVALPVGIAYAQLVGFPAIMGLYASIFPLLVYALIGSSKHLVVGPDAATCALLAVSTTAIVAQHPDSSAIAVAIAITGLSGMFCWLAGQFRLGLLADFLSRPILVGFLNGVAISIFLGQTAQLLGLKLQANNSLARVYELFQSVSNMHWPTAFVGGGTFLLIVWFKQSFNKLPAGLLALLIITVLVYWLELAKYGVNTLGGINKAVGFSFSTLLQISPFQIGQIISASLGVAVISFSSAIIASRSFAAYLGYDVDADREFKAIGLSNLVSACVGSFAISGASSRTAVNVNSGAKTQIAALLSALIVACVTFFLLEPLQYIPKSALSAILMVAAYSLVNFKALKELYDISATEMGLSLLTTFFVFSAGMMNGIAIAVGLSLIRFIHITARPTDAILSKVTNMAGFHDINKYRHHIISEPGLLIYRFNAPLVFFNAPYFKQRILAAARAQPDLKWVILDMLPISRMDATGMFILQEVKHELAKSNIKLVAAGRRSELLGWFQKTHHQISEADDLFPTLSQAFKAYRRERASRLLPILYQPQANTSLEV